MKHHGWPQNWGGVVSFRSPGLRLPLLRGSVKWWNIFYGSHAKCICTHVTINWKLERTTFLPVFVSCLSLLCFLSHFLYHPFSFSPIDKHGCCNGGCQKLELEGGVHARSPTLRLNRWRPKVEVEFLEGVVRGEPFSHQLWVGPLENHCKLPTRVWGGSLARNIFGHERILKMHVVSFTKVGKTVSRYPLAMPLFLS